MGVLISQYSSPIILSRAADVSLWFVLSKSCIDPCAACRFLFWHGPLARYVKLRVAHAPGMLGTYSPPSRVSDPDMYHGTCATHVPWCTPGSLTSDVFWSQCRGKLSQHSRRMRNLKFYVSRKRPISWGLVRRKIGIIGVWGVLSSTSELWQHTRWYWGWIIIVLYNEIVATWPQAISCYLMNRYLT